MPLSRTREGILYTRVASLLSGIALAAIFLYQMLLDYVLVHGGMYPSAGIIIASMVMLSFGAVFGFYGALALRNRMALSVPVISTLTLLAYFIQWQWCLRYCVQP